MWRKAIVGTMMMGALAAASAAAGVATDLSQTQPSQMTGTVEERDAAINKALAGDSKIARINLSELDMRSVLRLLGMQNKIDIVADPEALATQGVELGNVSVSLFNVTLSQVLEALRWEVAVKEGAVTWTVEGGALKLLKTAAPWRATEATGEKQLDEAQQAQLRAKFAQLQLNDMEVNSALRTLAEQNKLNLVVDWKELVRAGADPHAKLTLNLNGGTMEDVLAATLATIKLKEGAAGYEVWDGLVHISTRARLDREKPKIDAPGLP